MVQVLLMAVALAADPAPVDGPLKVFALRGSGQKGALEAFLNDNPGPHTVSMQRMANLWRAPESKPGSPERFLVKSALPLPASWKYVDVTITSTPATLTTVVAAFLYKDESDDQEHWRPTFRQLEVGNDQWGPKSTFEIHVRDVQEGERLLAIVHSEGAADRKSIRINATYKVLNAPQAAAAEPRLAPPPPELLQDLRKMAQAHKGPRTPRWGVHMPVNLEELKEAPKGATIIRLVYSDGKTKEVIPSAAGEPDRFWGGPKPANIGELSPEGDAAVFAMLYSDGSIRLPLYDHVIKVHVTCFEKIGQKLPDLPSLPGKGKE